MNRALVLVGVLAALAAPGVMAGEIAVPPAQVGADALGLFSLGDYGLPGPCQVCQAVIPAIGNVMVPGVTPPLVAFAFAAICTFITSNAGFCNGVCALPCPFFFSARGGVTVDLGGWLFSVFSRWTSHTRLA